MLPYDHAARTPVGAEEGYSVREDEVALLCEQTAQAMQAAGMQLVSVYLQAGASLRCYAVHGYAQLFDGIGPGAGVIGTSWQTGQAIELRAVAGHPTYRRAIPEVVDEVCVPVILGGRAVGAINAESTSSLPPDARVVLEDLAHALAVRLAELGGPPGLSPAQRLLTHATALAEADGAAAITAALLKAATQTSGMDSAMLLLGSPPRIAAVEGPLGPALGALDRDTLINADSWVAAGGSSRTAPDSGGLFLGGQQAFRDAGAGSLVLVSLGLGRERLGALVVADGRSAPVGPRIVESLELLSALATANLRSARSAERLRWLATTDPLTGLGHREGFSTALAQALAVVPDPLERRVAVVTVDLDGFKRVNDTYGHAAGDELLRRVADAMAGALREGDRLYRLGGDEFATVLPVHTVDEAVAVARRILVACRERCEATASLGVAVAHSGETPADVLARADAALYQTKRAGRDGLTVAD